MCGIGGVWCFEGRRLGKEDASRVKDVALLLQDRGEDAFGFFDGEKVVKFPGRAYEVIKNLEKLVPFESIVSGKRMFLVHTRLATQGEPIYNKNNHPFETKDFVIAHNGMVYSSKRYVASEEVIKKKKKENKGRDVYQYEVIDFEAVFGKKWEEIPETDSFEIAVELQKEFNETGDPVSALKGTMRYMFRKGVYALWVYSKTHDLLMLYRDSNPLYFGEKDGKLWFASEEWILRSIGVDNVSSLRAGKIYVFSESGMEDVVNVVSIVDYDPLDRLREYEYNCSAFTDCYEYKERYGVTFCENTECPLNKEDEDWKWRTYYWYYYE